jgi:hypothetical protein
MAPAYTTTYTFLNETFTDTYNFDPFATNTNPFNDQAVGAAVAGYAIALGESPCPPETTHLLSVFAFPLITYSSHVLGIIFGFHLIALIVVAIVYFKREKRRKVRKCLPTSLTQA